MRIERSFFTCSQFEFGSFDRGPKPTAQGLLEAETYLLEQCNPKVLATVVGTASTHQRQKDAERALELAGWRRVMSFGGAHDDSRVTTWMKVLRGAELPTAVPDGTR